MELSAINLLAVEAESVYGTDPTPTKAANLIPAVAGTLTWEPEATAITRKVLDGGFAKIPGFQALKTVTVKFRYELRGNRTNGTDADVSAGAIAHAVEIDPLLLAANLKATYTAEATPGARDGYVTYAPEVKTDAGPSVTVYWWSQLKLHKLTAGKVTFSIVADAGKPIYIDFTIRGKYATPTDVAMDTTGAAYLATVPPLFYATTGTIGSYSPVFSQLTLDIGNEIITRENALAADGIAGFAIADMSPKGTFNPEAVTEAANPFWADWAAQTHRALTMVVGGDVGNKITLTAGLTYDSVKYSDANKMRVHSASFTCVRSTIGSATPEFSIKFH